MSEKPLVSLKAVWEAIRADNNGAAILIYRQLRGGSMIDAKDAVARMKEELG